MAIGLSTYAFFWRTSAKVVAPLSLHDMVKQTNELGCTVLQICDYPAVETLTPSELLDIHDVAVDLGIEIELGTRGIDPAHLHRYLEIAEPLGATLIRSMLHTATHKPAPDDAVALLKTAMRAFENQGVELALETYEQVRTADLLEVVEGVGSDALGICLDPGNCVAGLELPHDVVERTAPHVKNMHIKDFAFTRQPGWVGFTLAGCPLGEGLLDYDEMITVVDPESRGINQIVEHWLPWQDDADTTCSLEAQWTEHSINYLRSRT
ncbi:sugar phosphate isomerase/epimerase family protein [Mycobacterium sp.]|uniref:sugar phosphate isomerase/epimerase family protein n=1 Tax=Mycobacterium sp. TaxID=1785 RepID=UPI002D9C58BF|nr:TIM barrel protein [Mycobacterium sp.]